MGISTEAINWRTSKSFTDKILRSKLVLLDGTSYSVLMERERKKTAKCIPHKPWKNRWGLEWAGCEQLIPTQGEVAQHHLIPKEKARDGGWGDKSFGELTSRGGESEPHLATPTDLSKLPALVTSSEARKQEAASMTSPDSQTPYRGTCPQEVMK